MRKIDFEAHYYTKDFLEAISNRVDIPSFRTSDQSMHHGGDGHIGIRPIIPKLLELGEKRLVDMDEAGVDVAILSASLGVEQLPEEMGCREAKQINDALGKAISEHPDRYKGYAVLNVKNVHAAVKELERCRKEYGFVGWNAFSNYGEQKLDDPEMYTLFETAVKLGMFVYIHPTVPVAECFCGWGPALATSGLGFAEDVAVALTRLILSGIFDKLPELKIVIGHSGEAFPFLIQRLDDAFIRAKWMDVSKNKKMPSEYFKTNIWVTTSGNFSVPAFECAYKTFGIERLLFGSDYPMESLVQSVEFIDNLLISVKGAEKIYYQNAENYFGL